MLPRRDLGFVGGGGNQLGDAQHPATVRGPALDVEPVRLRRGNYSTRAIAGVKDRIGMMFVRASQGQTLVIQRRHETGALVKVPALQSKAAEVCQVFARKRREAVRDTSEWVARCRITKRRAYDHDAGPIGQSRSPRCADSRVDERLPFRSQVETEAVAIAAARA